MLQAPRNPLDTASMLSDATEDVIRALLVKGEFCERKICDYPMGHLRGVVWARVRHWHHLACLYRCATLACHSWDLTCQSLRTDLLLKNYFPRGFTYYGNQEIDPSGRGGHR